MRNDKRNVHRKVSIHALTRRATLLIAMVERLFAVSIHALTRRATNLHIIAANFHRVSIHALTRRATLDGKLKLVKWEFQSTPSRGGRP